MRILLSTLMALGILMPPVMARPVSYPSGVTVSTTNDSQANVLLTHYSPTARYSIGHRLEYLRDDETVLNAFQANVLLKRWNGSDSQANLYLKNGIGIARSNQGIFDGELEPAAFTAARTIMRLCSMNSHTARGLKNVLAVDSIQIPPLSAAPTTREKNLSRKFQPPISVPPAVSALPQSSNPPPICKAGSRC